MFHGETNTHYIIEYKRPSSGRYTWDKVGAEYTEKQYYDVLLANRARRPQEQFRAVKVTVTHEVLGDV